MRNLLWTILILKTMCAIISSEEGFHKIFKVLLPKSQGGADNRIGFKITWPDKGDFQYVADLGPQIYTEPLGVPLFKKRSNDKLTQKKHADRGQEELDNHKLESDRRQTPNNRQEFDSEDEEGFRFFQPFQNAVRGMFSFVAEVSDNIRERFTDIRDTIADYLSLR